jgi:heme/copper-type cytochrome/quinol oxidase subunit 2
MFLAGIGVAYAVATIWAPHWPRFCDDITVGEPCAALATQTMAGYLLMALGIVVMILGPVAGAMIELVVHGHRWETPRGRETVTTNVPIVLGAVYAALGIVLAATA